MSARALLLAGLLAPSTVTGAQEARIEQLHVQRDGQRLLVSFELVDGVDEPMLNKIQSGLPTELEYTFRLHRPRTWWFDKTYSRSTLQIIAMYNAVTQEYLINYKQDGRLIESRVVTDLQALHQAMALINALPAFGDIEDKPPQRTQLQVRADFGQRHVLLLFPTRINTSWARFRIVDAALAPSE